MRGNFRAAWTANVTQVADAFRGKVAFLRFQGVCGAAWTRWYMFSMIDVFRCKVRQDDDIFEIDQGKALFMR